MPVQSSELYDRFWDTVFWETVGYCWRDMCPKTLFNQTVNKLKLETERAELREGAKSNEG